MTPQVDNDKPIALLDLDGSAADFDSAMRREWAKISSHDDPYPLERTNEPYYYTARRDLIKSLPGFWSGLEPLRTGMLIKQALERHGFQIHVLTAGSLGHPPCWMEKIEWCNEHLPNIPVTITRNKGLVYGAILVDDWLPYIDSWLKHRPRGLVICPAQPWNASLTSLSHPQVYRVSELQILHHPERLDEVIEKRKAALTPLD